MRRSSLGLFTVHLFFSSDVQGFSLDPTSSLSFLDLSKKKYRFQPQQRVNLRLSYSEEDRSIDEFIPRNTTRFEDSFSTKTSQHLANRIVNRGFATMGQQLRRQQDKQRLEKKKQREREESKLRNLELKWKLETSEDCDTEDVLSCSEPCETCRGKGKVSCEFCKGVGFVDFGEGYGRGTVGNRMEKKNGGKGTGIECPCCNEDGDTTCTKCNGSGWIAKWQS